jgi:hypothetical protein
MVFSSTQLKIKYLKSFLETMIIRRRSLEEQLKKNRKAVLNRIIEKKNDE